MRIHADLSRPVTLDAGAIYWTPSPTPGVDRKMLYREGDEVARATSLVRYAPGPIRDAGLALAAAEAANAAAPTDATAT